jgi:hypothetical protein
MANFNLADYETVEERLVRFYKDNPDGRVITENETTDSNRLEKIWLVRAVIYLSGEDLERGCPKATGYAFEIDGTAGANKAAALENCETSAIGRALANGGYSGNKRTTREEMDKVARFEASQKARDWVAEAKLLKDVDAVRLLWGEASKAGAPDKVLNDLRAYAEKLTPAGKRDGASASVPGGATT